jgi:S-adenosylmethionine:tRNA ribosyltransferase-isomerase
MKKLNAIRRFNDTKLMVIDTEKTEFETFAGLENYLNSKDLLVMNISGTIPGSIWVSRNAEYFEIRLAAFAGSDLQNLREWWAISFGSGSWETLTEERGQAHILSVGEELNATNGLQLEVLDVDEDHSRLLKIAFLGKNFLESLYQQAAPIQYSYQAESLQLWDVQTPLAQIPLSVEAPSALFPFSWEKLLQLQSKFRVAFLYHGAGISSTGEQSLDERLPLPEFYSIPSETVKAWQETRKAGGRIIAIGTSVARALESARAIAKGQPRNLEGITTLRVSKDCRMERVDGMLTGYHDPLTSHFELEAAFVGESRLAKAFTEAKARGFQKHDFGDVTLLLNGN